MSAMRVPDQLPQFHSEVQTDFVKREIQKLVEDIRSGVVPLTMDFDDFSDAEEADHERS